MRRVYIRILCAFLIVCFLASFSSCNSGNSSDSSTSVITSDTSTEDIPQEQQIKFTITGSYDLVRPENGGDLEIKALQLLYRGLKSTHNIEFSLKTDLKRKDQKPGEFEILVGDTNRNESSELKSMLSDYDWAYKIVSPNVIAICGGTPQATLEGVRAFLLDLYGYSENEENGEVKSEGALAELAVGTEKIYRHVFKLGGRNILDYSLVVKSENAAGANLIIDEIDRLTGQRLPIVTLDKYQGGPAIFFGFANINGDHLDKTMYGNSRYYIEGSGENVIIDFKSDDAGKAAGERFVSEYLLLNANNKETYPLEQSEALTGIYVSDELLNGLGLDKKTKTAVAEGITYEEHLYYDSNGDPVRAYILTIAKGAGLIQTTMPADGMTPGRVTDMMEQVSAAVKNGKNVICGVNADFFDIGASNVMLGLCIKDGKEIHGTGDRPWFGVTADGEAVIGTADQYENYKNKLTTAVGGSNIILKNDEVFDVSGGRDRHPRTAVGFKEDGSIVLMVVDGRQSKISNGASLADIAEIMASLGCTDAINLDGGGSSTFIIKDKSGNFNVENSPSDGTLRSVANGLMVVLP